MHGHNANHTLRASSVMYNARIPEKLIQERTGHRSLEALRTYEWSSEYQQKAAVSTLISVPQELAKTTLQKKTVDIRTSARSFFYAN